MIDPRIASFDKIIGLELKIAAVDIGASAIDGDKPYSALLNRGELNVVGFEPSAEALAELNRAKGPQETYLPYALGDGGVHTLKLCKCLGMTSLLEPNPAIFPYFHGFAEWAEIVERIELKTVRLDDVVEIKALDYLKIDVQGAELMVFQNARRLLSECVVIQTEVEFLPLYKDQPLFSDVETFLRSQGFILHRFVPAPHTRMVSPLVMGGDILNGLSQVFDSDVVFIRDFTKPDLMTSSQMLKMAKVLHEIYGSYDVVLRLLLDHDGRFGTSYGPRYLSHLSAATGVPDQSAA